VRGLKDFHLIDQALPLRGAGPDRGGHGSQAESLVFLKVGIVEAIFEEPSGGLVVGSVQITFEVGGQDGGPDVFAGAFGVEIGAFAAYAELIAVAAEANTIAEGTENRGGNGVGTAGGKIDGTGSSQVPATFLYARGEELRESRGEKH
jgi:hypothetical protein